MAGYELIFSDIRSAAMTFQQEGANFAMITPDSGPAVPGGIDASLSTALSRVLPAIGLMHDAVAGCMKTHAGKLHSSYNAYKNAEVDSKQDIDAILMAISDPSRIPSAPVTFYGPPS